jgi:hypothetical protein
MERNAARRRDQVEEGVFDGRLGHAVAADAGETGFELAQLDARLDERQEEILDDVGGRPGRLVEVEGVGVGDALAPGLDAPGFEPQEEGVLDGPGVDARPERGDERQADRDEVDAFERGDGVLEKREGERRASGYGVLLGIDISSEAMVYPEWDTIQ